MSHDPSAAMPPSAAPPPWGLLGSVAWGALGIAVWFIGQFVALSIYLATRDPGNPVDLQALRHDGFLLAVVTIAAAPAWIAVSAFAARQCGWSVRGYLALIWPRRNEIAFGIACLAVLLVAADLLSFALGRDLVPRFLVETYTSARNSGSLVLFLVAVVIVAPIGEEIAFRGFLFRGLSVSVLGVAGTMVVTSAAWAALHVQYDAIVLVQILLIGMLLGWLRWASGSTLLTILLHMLTNLAASIQAAIKVEWMG